MEIPPLASRGGLALSEPELVSWGQRFGHQIAPPLVVAIAGEMGAGKTTLVRAICQGYGVHDDVTSPTYTLVHEYVGDRSKVYHLDLYRLRGSSELLALGWDDMIGESSLVLVEWPDRAGSMLGPGHVAIELHHIQGEPTRRLLYAGGHS